jgi:hypothetical protein
MVGSEKKYAWVTSALSSLLLAACGQKSADEASIASLTSKQKQTSSELIETHCISKHIREAIALNEARLPLYSALSGGRSKPISDSLIKLEKLVLATLPTIEKPAEAYQKAGIPLFCLDVVPMKDTAEFTKEMVKPLSPFKPFNGLTWSLALGQSLFNPDEKVLENKLEQALAILNQNQSFNCMTRHMIESILRSVRLAPVYRQMSAERGMRDPSHLIKSLVHTQVLALGIVAHLDEQAAVLNAEGIPIICRDVPYIETKLEKILK